MKQEPGDFERRPLERVGIPADPAALYQQIREHDEFAIETLWTEIHRRWKRWTILQIGEADGEDLVDEIFGAALEGIWQDAVRQPDMLWRWVEGIVRFQILGSIEVRMRRRKHLVESSGDAFDSILHTVAEPSPGPERLLLDEEARQTKAHLFYDSYSALSMVNREIIRRFYFCHESHELIEQELYLTPNQFRLHKWRARVEMQVHVHRAIEKQRLIECCRKRPA